MTRAFATLLALFTIAGCSRGEVRLLTGCHESDRVHCESNAVQECFCSCDQPRAQGSLYEGWLGCKGETVCKWVATPCTAAQRCQAVGQSAVCAGDAQGNCHRGDSPRCVDAQSYLSCAVPYRTGDDGLLEKKTCPEHTRCKAVNASYEDPCVHLRDWRAGPGLISWSRGEASIVEPDGGSTTVEPPMVLTPGERVAVSDGGAVAVIVQDEARAILGPKTEDPFDRPQADGDADPDLLALYGSATPPAPAPRKTTARLLRPVPGETLESFSGVAWSCSRCDKLEVRVFDSQLREVWARIGDATHTLKYEGPRLPPGLYSVSLGKEAFAFRVGEPGFVEQAAEVREVSDRIRGTAKIEDLDLADSIVPALLWKKGLYTPMLASLRSRVDTMPTDAEAKRMLSVYAARVGAAP